jgi:hypothetical protein
VNCCICIIIFLCESIKLFHTYEFLFFICSTYLEYSLKMEKTSYDTVIIGAGLAGISAARTLIQNGVKDVLILEGNWKPVFISENGTKCRA